MVIAIIIAFVIFVYIFALALCKTASESDERMRIIFKNERFVNESKNKSSKNNNSGEAENPDERNSSPVQIQQGNINKI